MGGTGRPLGKTFFLHCQRRHPGLPKIPTYLPHILWGPDGAHIDDVCLGTKTQEDHLILLGEFFAVCQENHTRLKLEKYELMQETMQYLGFDVGYGWWTPAASNV